MPKKLKTTILLLRIGNIVAFLGNLLFSAILLLVGFASFSDSEEKVILIVYSIAVVVLAFALLIFVEVVLHGLKNFKSWTWKGAVASSIIFLLSLPTIVFGIFGLMNLFDPEIKKLYEKNNQALETK